MALRGEFFVFLIVCFLIFSPRPILDTSDTDRKLLDIYNQERNRSRAILFNSTYSLGYGNITGFRLSYGDATEQRNVSLYPFPDRDYDHFEETEELSILPDYVRDSANGIWYGNNNNKENDHDNDDTLKTLYMQNLTATFRGVFKRPQSINFTEIDMPIPEYVLPYMYNSPFDPPDETSGNNDEGRYAANGDANNAATDSFSKSSDGNGFGEDMSANAYYDSNYGALDFNEAVRSGDIKSFNEGNLIMELEARRNENNVSYTDILPISMSLKLSDPNETIQHSLSLHGLYFSQSGNLFAVSRSAKFQSTYALPHLLLNAENFDTAKQYMKERSDYYAANTENTNFTLAMMKEDAKLANKCEYLTYLHFEPTNLTQSQLDMIRDELDHPIGRPIPTIPDLVIQKGIFYSPDCGIVAEVDNVVGTSRTVQIAKIRKVIIAITLAILAQIYLLIRQMNRTNTPPTLSRISYYTLYMMNLVDGTSMFLLLLTTAIISDLYVTTAIATLMAFTLSAIFEIRYMIGIYQSQVNERSMDFWTSLRGTFRDNSGATDDDNEHANNHNNSNITSVNNNTDSTNVSEPTLSIAQPPPPPPPTQTQPQPQPQPAIDDERAISSRVYSIFLFLLIFFSFVVLHILELDRVSRNNAEKFIIVVINSYWYPQIIRNITRGSSTSFTWEFMLGSTIIRLLPIYYVYGAQDNPFHHHLDKQFLVGLTLWKTAALVVIFIQQKFGARILIPKQFLPKIYNYHPVLSLDDIENGFGIAFKEGASKTNHEGQTDGDENNSSDKPVFKVDCAICMTEVELPVVVELLQQPQHHDNVDERDSLLSAKKVVPGEEYMVTPCKHIFHTECLENWMRYKLQCPVCRNSLPPV